MALTAGFAPGWGVVYRHFGAPGCEGLAMKLARVCRNKDWRLLIANDPELARQVGADGVHWPEAQAHLAKRWAGKFRLMTMSWHQSKPIAKLPRGIDAALVSTIFPSKSKTATSALGPRRARKIARMSRAPLYALGGINARNAHSVAGHMGIAFVENSRAFLR